MAIQFLCGVWSERYDARTASHETLLLSFRLTLRSVRGDTERPPITITFTTLTIPAMFL